MGRRFFPIVLGGAVAGTLDITAAATLSAAFGRPPVVMLQGIAYGALGPPAFEGGLSTAGLGLLFHFIIAFVATAIYDAASRRWESLVRRPLAGGAAYGVAVYLFMNAVVLPLSRVGFRMPPWYQILTMIDIHIVCVGLPIALCVAWGPGREDDPAGATR